MIAKSEVKYIQSLAHKKFREEEGVFVIEGVKMVGELLTEFPKKIVQLYATQQWLDESKSILPFEIPIIVVDEKELLRISQLKTPNQVIATVKIPEPTIDADSNGVTLVLDQIQDPGNLGTIIRTCDWFGVQTIICSLDTVDAYNPKTVQAAKGSLLRMNIQYRNLCSYLEATQGVPVYAALLDGKSIHEIQVKGPTILVIGNEANGISKEVLALTSDAITIPRKGSAESLNAAIATAIILAHLSK